MNILLVVEIYLIYLLVVESGFRKIYIFWLTCLFKLQHFANISNNDPIYIIILVRILRISNIIKCYTSRYLLLLYYIIWTYFISKTMRLETLDTFEWQLVWRNLRFDLGSCYIFQDLQQRTNERKEKVQKPCCFGFFNDSFICTNKIIPTVLRSPKRHSSSDPYFISIVASRSLGRNGTPSSSPKLKFLLLAYNSSIVTGNAVLLLHQFFPQIYLPTNFQVKLVGPV